MKIVVHGTWNPKISELYLSLAQSLGKSLAERGHTLITSPSSGFQGLVAKAYKESMGKRFIGYFPDLDIMNEVGEEVLVQPDEPVYTGLDYPFRNLTQIKMSEGVIAITGAYGTLSEIISSVYDYNLPTAFFKGSSEIIDRFLANEPNFRKTIMYDDNISNLIDYVETQHYKKEN